MEKGISVQKKKEGKPDWWEVTEDYSFMFFTGEFFVIPAGFITDFASVPRFLWSIIPPNGRTAPASVLHDFLYENTVGDRLMADLFFYYELRKAVGNTQALIMYTAVRLFGAYRWEKFRKNGK